MYGRVFAMFLLSNCGASTVTTRKVECHLARAMNEKLEHDEWNLLIVAALFNPKTPTQNVYVIRTHAHTIACGKLQMISSSRSLTYVSMQLSFAKCYIAIHVDVCKQSSTTSEQAGQSLWKKVMHTYIFAQKVCQTICGTILLISIRDAFMFHVILLFVNGFDLFLLCMRM